jgi:hypothetical protein
MAALWARCTTNPDFLWTGQDDPNAIPFEDWIPELKWTDGMRDIATFARRMAEKILSRTITVKLPPKNHLPSVPATRAHRRHPMCPASAERGSWGRRDSVDGHC